MAVTQQVEGMGDVTLIEQTFLGSHDPVPILGDFSRGVGYSKGNPPPDGEGLASAFDILTLIILQTLSLLYHEHSL